MPSSLSLLETAAAGALDKARGMDAASLVAIVERSGLRGRGGAGFPLATKLAAVREGEAASRYVVANAYDADPASPTTRTLVERRAALALDGIAIAAHACGAREAWLYLHPEATAARAAAETALASRVADPELRIEIAIGPGNFIGGEESAMLNVLESKRAMPRQRPPYPARQGLRLRPTLVASAETLAWLPLIVAHGVDAFRALGTKASPGSKLVTVTGAVAHAGVREVPFGITLGEILDASGAAAGGAIHVGGPTGGLLAAAKRSVRLDFDDLRAAGTHLGSAQVRAVAPDACAVAEATTLFAYLARENCTIDVACRVGTKRIGAILEGILSGIGRPADLDWLRELATHLERASLCGIGRTAPAIVRSTLADFADHYHAHIVERRCPAGTCLPLRQRRFETMAQP